MPVLLLVLVFLNLAATKWTSRENSLLIEARLVDVAWWSTSCKWFLGGFLSVLFLDLSTFDFFILAWSFLVSTLPWVMTLELNSLKKSISFGSTSHLMPLYLAPLVRNLCGSLSTCSGFLIWPGILIRFVDSESLEASLLSLFQVYSSWRLFNWKLRSFLLTSAVCLCTNLTVVT